MEPMSTTTKNTKTTKNTTTSTDNTTARPSFWASVRDDLRERREARAQRASLYRELNGYHSRTDILDLLVALDHRSQHERPRPGSGGAFRLLRSAVHQVLRPAVDQ